MLKFIKNLFPLRVKTLDGFISLVGQEGCKLVIVEPTLSAKNSAKTTSVGTIANFQYFLKFTSKTPRGRKIVYHKTSFQRFGSNRGFADVKERGKMAIKLLLIGEKRVKYLKSKLPDITVDLIGQGNEPIDDTLLKKLHKDAAKVGLL